MAGSPGKKRKGGDEEVLFEGGGAGWEPGGWLGGARWKAPQGSGPKPPDGWPKGRAWALAGYALDLIEIRGKSYRLQRRAQAGKRRGRHGEAKLRRIYNAGLVSLKWPCWYSLKWPPGVQG